VHIYKVYYKCRNNKHQALKLYSTFKTVNICRLLRSVVSIYFLKYYGLVVKCLCVPVSMTSLYMYIVYILKFSI